MSGPQDNYGSYGGYQGTYGGYSASNSSSYATAPQSSYSSSHQGGQNSYGTGNPPAFNQGTYNSGVGQGYDQPAYAQSQPQGYQYSSSSGYSSGPPPPAASASSYSGGSAGYGQHQYSSVGPSQSYGSTPGGGGHPQQQQPYNSSQGYSQSQQYGSAPSAAYGGQPGSYPPPASEPKQSRFDRSDDGNGSSYGYSRSDEPGGRPSGGSTGGYSGPGGRGGMPPSMSSAPMTGPAQGGPPAMGPRGGYDRSYSGGRDHRSGDMGHGGFSSGGSSQPGNYGGPPRNEGRTEVMPGAIFISGMPRAASEKDIENHFGSIGIIKMDKKTNKPRVWLYKERDGSSKGEATVTYEDPEAAGAAITWFNGKEFMGSKIQVTLAERKVDESAMAGRGRGGGDYRGGGGRGRGGFSSGPGDWTCPQCSNTNFARRDECNRCKTPKPPGAGGDMDGPGGFGGGYRGGRGGGRGYGHDGMGDRRDRRDRPY